jgi:hypothetical protein
VTRAFVDGDYAYVPSYQWSSAQRAQARAEDERRRQKVEPSDWERMQQRHADEMAAADEQRRTEANQRAKDELLQEFNAKKKIEIELALSALGASSEEISRVRQIIERNSPGKISDMSEHERVLVNLRSVFGENFKRGSGGTA